MSMYESASARRCACNGRDQSPPTKDYGGDNRTGGDAKDCVCSNKLVRATIHAIVPEICVNNHSRYCTNEAVGVGTLCNRMANYQNERELKECVCVQTDKEDVSGCSGGSVGLIDESVQTIQTMMVTSTELEYMCKGLRPKGYKESVTEPETGSQRMQNCTCCHCREMAKKKGKTANRKASASSNKACGCCPKKQKKQTAYSRDGSSERRSRRDSQKCSPCLMDYHDFQGGRGSPEFRNNRDGRGAGERGAQHCPGCQNCQSCRPKKSKCVIM